MKTDTIIRQNIRPFFYLLLVGIGNQIWISKSVRQDLSSFKISVFAVEGKMAAD